MITVYVLLVWTAKRHLTPLVSVHPTEADATARRRTIEGVREFSIQRLEMVPPEDWHRI